MTEFNLSDRILATSSDIYLYGEIIYEKGSITNLRVIKTNFNETSVNDRLIDEIKLYKLNQINWKKHLSQMTRLDTYNAENIEINKISKHEMIIWIKNDNKQKMEEIKFANISHEFKTPINLISSALQVLKFNLEQLDIDESLYKKYLRISDQNILRLLKLINNLIDSTKISSDYVEFSPQNYDIVHFVENIIMSLVEYCNQNEIEIIFDTEFEEKIIYFDLTKMEQIILNLVSNAIKYSDGDCILVTISQVGQMIQISVKDNGRGIPKDKLTYIFNRFTQIDDHFKKSNEGSGIGLYLVRAFAQMHEGKVEVESVWGEGAEFKVEIPDRQGEDTYEQTKKENDNGHIDRIKVEFSDIYK